MGFSIVYQFNTCHRPNYKPTSSSTSRAVTDVSANCDEGSEAREMK